jgi:hypothetical protein
MLVIGCFYFVIFSRMASMSLVSNFLAFKVSIISVSSTGHSAPVKAF